MGLPYGIANPAGRTPAAEAAAIIAAAGRLGIVLLDTAPGYGVSEEIIGSSLPKGHRFRIVTKTPLGGPEADGEQSADRLEITFLSSLTKLGQTKLYGLLAHRASDLLSPGGSRVFDRMIALRERGLVEKIGASVYSAAEIDAILDRFDIDLIQVPVNVFDQRLLRSGHLKKLRSRGVEIHARSLFLQGLLLMPPEEVPARLGTLSTVSAAYHGILRDKGLSPVRGALGFIAGIGEIDVALVGVDNRAQLDEIHAAFGFRDDMEYGRFAVDDEALVDPSRWPGGDRR